MASLMVVGCGQGKLQDMVSLPRVLQGKAGLCPHRDLVLLSGLLCPSGARVGDSRATSCWEGAGMPRGAPGQPQPAAPLPGTHHFPSQLAQFLLPAVEQAPPLPPAQSCTLPFPVPFHPFSLISIQPYVCSSCNWSCSGKNKGKGCLHFPTSEGSLHLRGPNFRAALLPRATSGAQSCRTWPGGTCSVQCEGTCAPAQLHQSPHSVNSSPQRGQKDQESQLRTFGLTDSLLNETEEGNILLRAIAFIAQPQQTPKHPVSG